MKILIISDTHGNIASALEILKRAKGFNRLVHLGDHYQDGLAIAEKLTVPVDAVAGNTDIYTAPDAPREKLLAIGNYRISITHGDLYSAKRGIDRLQEKAIEESVDVVLFGHTHFPLKKIIGNTLFINPGCILPGIAGSSYAVLTIINGSISSEIVRL